VREGVVANPVAFSNSAADNIAPFRLSGFPAEHEKRGFDPMAGQAIEYRWCY